MGKISLRQQFRVEVGRVTAEKVLADIKLSIYRRLVEKYYGELPVDLLNRASQILAEAIARGEKTRTAQDISFDIDALVATYKREEATAAQNVESSASDATGSAE